MGQIAVIAVVWALGAFGITWIGGAILAPVWFARTLSFQRILGGGARWWHMPIGTLIMIAVGRTVYCAFYAITFVIPPDWGDVGDDGSWTSTRFFIQSLAAFCLTIPLTAILERRALSEASMHRSRNDQ